MDDVKPNKLNISMVLFNNDSKTINSILKKFLQIKVLNKIYIIDNSKTPLIGIKPNDKISYQFNNKNLGYGKGHNIALKRTLELNIDYHLVANVDIDFNPEDVDKMVGFMETENDIGLLVPKVEYPDGEIQNVVRLLPSPLDIILRIPLIGDRIFKKRSDLHIISKYKYDRIINVPFLSGCFMLLRTSILRKVGLFDERFFLYAEDLDLSRRIHSITRTIINPKFIIKHEHQKASSKSFQAFRLHLASIVKYFMKYGWFFDKQRESLNDDCLKQFL